MAQSINITELHLPQLEMLKNQLDQEVEFFSTSIAQLKVVQTKYVEAKDCLNMLNKSNEGKQLHSSTCGSRMPYAHTGVQPSWGSWRRWKRKECSTGVERRGYNVRCC
uniref:Prefoldin subunit 5 n=2 Tax=Cercopithecinae TaxID=9528 RepID=A0A2K6C0R7_MACNE